MFFISVVWKLSVDLRPQKSGLKGVYSLKFFYLDEDENLFLNNGMEMAKMQLFVGTKILKCTSYFKKYSHGGTEEWTECPALCQ